MILATESQHAIQWFIYDPSAFFSQAREHNIPHNWIESAQQGLQRINPYVQNLDCLWVNSDNESDLAFRLDLPH